VLVGIEVVVTTTGPGWKKHLGGIKESRDGGGESYICIIDLLLF